MTKTQHFDTVEQCFECKRCFVFFANGDLERDVTDALNETGKSFEEDERVTVETETCVFTGEVTLTKCDRCDPKW